MNLDIKLLPFHRLSEVSFHDFCMNAGLSRLYTLIVRKEKISVTLSFLKIFLLAFSKNIIII